MKTPKQNSKGLCLKTSSNRWKWMAGATAATAAGVTASQASTITINLANNYIGFGGDNLNADLTGDGHPDLTIANAYGSGIQAQVSLNGVPAYMEFSNLGAPTYLDAFMRLGSRRAFWHQNTHTVPSTTGTPSLMGSIPIFFKDLHINGGAPTRGSLEVTVSPGYIVLDSFTYNTPVQFSSRAVPDEGSSLALLAMGAGGVLALRRSRAAQGRS
jgi:hypothetical protein